MGKLLEAFKILCTDFDHILEKAGKLKFGMSINHHFREGEVND